MMPPQVTCYISRTPFSKTPDPTRTTDPPKRDARSRPRAKPKPTPKPNQDLNDPSKQYSSTNRALSPPSNSNSNRTTTTRNRNNTTNTNTIPHPHPTSPQPNRTLNLPHPTDDPHGPYQRRNLQKVPLPLQLHPKAPDLAEPEPAVQGQAHGAGEHGGGHAQGARLRDAPRGQGGAGAAALEVGVREQDLEEDVSVSVGLVVGVVGLGGWCGWWGLVPSVPRVEERGLVFVERRAEGGLAREVTDGGWGGGVSWGGG